MFSQYGTFLSGVSNYDWSSMIFSIIDIVLVAFQLMIELPLMILGAVHHQKSKS